MDTRRFCMILSCLHLFPVTGCCIPVLERGIHTTRDIVTVGFMFSSFAASSEQLLSCSSEVHFLLLLDIGSYEERPAADSVHTAWLHCLMCLLDVSHCRVWSMILCSAMWMCIFRLEPVDRTMPAEVTPATFLKELSQDSFRNMKHLKDWHIGHCLMSFQVFGSCCNCFAFDVAPGCLHNEKAWRTMCECRPCT